MSVLGRAYVVTNLLQNPALALLRSHNLPITAAFLGEYFQNSAQRVFAGEMHIQMEEDLAQLAGHDMDIDHSPAKLCATWVREGILARRHEPGSREEYYELTVAGQRMLAYLDQLENPRVAATQSRLAMLTDQLDKLAIATNPDREMRINALRRQKELIDQQIEAIESGKQQPIETPQALEMLAHITEMAREVPADFARVKDAFESINRNLRRNLLDPDRYQEATLTEVFLGLDHINQSDAGKSFNAFYELLVNQAQKQRFNDAAQQLSDLPIFQQLSATDRTLLTGYMSMLMAHARPIHQTIGHLSRSLRQLVQSRQVNEYRAMAELLTRIERTALEAAPQLRPYTKMQTNLAAAKMKFTSVGRLQPYIPSMARTDQPIETAAVSHLDLQTLKELIRESEIDRQELINNVNATLKAGPATIATVLEKYPATQGLASIIGLLILATEHATRLADTEIITWQGQFDQVTRCATIDQYLFERQTS